MEINVNDKVIFDFFGKTYKGIVAEIDEPFVFIKTTDNYYEIYKSQIKQVVKL